MSDELSVIGAPSQIVPMGETAATSVAAQAEALVKARYAIAVSRPRDWDVARDRLLRTCKRPAFAEGAMYLKPVGKGIVGPSIRFAEECARSMGNLDNVSMVVFDDDSKRIVRVYVTDMESNSTYSTDVTVLKSVERKSLRKGQIPISVRTNSDGDKTFTVLATEDELLAKQRSGESKAMRGSILRLMPSDIVEEALEVCRKVKASSASLDPGAERKKLFDAFSSIGVSASQIKEFLGSDAAVLMDHELAELRAMYTTIKDGESKWSDYASSNAEPPANESSHGGIESVRDVGRNVRED